jgi:hypothetical protein
MAFNTPKFNTPKYGDPTPPTTPLIVTSNLFSAISTNRLDNQYEKVGNNVGFVNASFEAMIKSVGWQGSQPWCAFYVKLLFMQMFSFDRVWLSQNIGGSAMGNLVAIENLNKRGDNRYVAFRTNDVQVGDVFCLQYGKGGHTGIVTEVLGKSGDGFKVKTLEGNTATSGTREGDKTATLQRTMIIGKDTLGGILKGYWRRNFTDAEKDQLRYDEQQGTFIFSGQQVVNPKGWATNPLNPFNIQK